MYVYPHMCVIVHMGVYVSVYVSVSEHMCDTCTYVECESV